MNVEDALDRLARFEEKRPFVAIGILLIFTFVISSGFFLVKSESSFEDFVPDDVEVITAIEEVRSKFSTSTQSIILVFRINPEDPNAISDIRDKAVLEAMDIIVKQVEKDEFVLSSSSILDFVREDGRIPDQREINSRLEAADTSSMLNDKLSFTIVRFTVAAGLSIEDRESLAEYVTRIAAMTNSPPGVEILPAGDIILDVEIPKAIGQRTGLVTILGFVLVFFVLLVIYRRISFAAITMTPVIFGTVWTFGTLGIIGIPLTTALVGIFSMIIGLGIDFGIHIVHRFEEDKKRSTIEEAIHGSVRHVGRGLTLTSFTTIIGFMALLSATLPALKDMAIALSFGVVYSLIAAIVLIPAVLVLVERRHSRKKHYKGRRSRK